jgi:transcriptional regulator with XRE-family HTH domain
MIFLEKNIRLLRRHRGMTQDHLAKLLETKRSLIGSYEEGRAVPKLELLSRMAEVFGVELQEFLTKDLEKEGDIAKFRNSELRILSVAVTPDQQERISLVPVKAAAGYLQGRADPEYIGSLPHFSMPVAELSRQRTYRVFQLKGDSMLPLTPGTYVFCDYVENVTDMRDGKCYVLITADEGIVYKRVFHEQDDKWLLKSDNPDYEPYRIHRSEVLEVWRALGFLSFDLPEPEEYPVQKLTAALEKLQDEVSKLRGL